MPIPRPARTLRTSALLLLMFAAAGNLRADETVTAEPPAESSTTPAGINDNFLNPDLDPEEWVKRFEIESREVYAGQASVLKAMHLKPGMAVADVGSGTGLYTAPFSKAVGASGRIYAVDISPRLIDYVTRRIKAENLDNVRPVLSTATSTKLQAACVDRVFVCDTYHHFEDYKAMLASIHQALRPGGEFILVEFNRIPGESRDWLLTHVRAGKQTFRSEVEAAGFKFVEEVDIPEFEENYFLRFRKPATVSN